MKFKDYPGKGFNMRGQYLFMRVIALLISVGFIACAHNSRAIQNYPSNINQSNVEISQQENSTDNKQIIKEEGWEIPGLTQSEVVIPRRKFKAEGDLYTTVYKPKQLFITDGYFSLEERNALRLDPELELKVDTIVRFDIGGRVFCYQVLVVPVHVEKKKPRQYMGIIRALHFYDMNGDSTFESVEWGQVHGFVPRIPEWLQFGGQ